MNSLTPQVKDSSPWTVIIGYAVAAIALLWVFHGINVGFILQDLSSIKWPLAIAGMFFDIGRYITQSFRWKFLLSSLGKISFLKTFRALYSGVFLNMVFPMRLGEVARAYIASRSADLPLPSALSSLLVEYLFDGFWLALGIGLAGFFVALPVQIMGAARILGGLIITASVIFFIIIFRKIPFIEKTFSKSDGQGKPVFAGIAVFLRELRIGMQSMSKSKLFIPAFFLSALDLFFHAGAFWIIMNAYGIHLPFLISTAVVFFVFVGLIVPNAPSNVGAFQFLCVIALMAVGIDKTHATGFSIFVFVLVSIPQMTIGAIAFGASGKTLSEIKNEAKKLRRKK
ncbi:MAG TPA: hypothetical protein DCO75_01320 [Fibrobacteres bacterium]|nr:hypothetical protein [Fibrobacterota bacterium]